MNRHMPARVTDEHMPEDCPICTEAMYPAPDHLTDEQADREADYYYERLEQVADRRFPMTEPTPNYMSIQDAAKYLGVTTKTIRRRIADESLPAYRIGTRLIRIDQADLDQLLVPVITSGSGR